MFHPFSTFIRALALGAALLVPTGAWAQKAPPQATQPGPPVRDGGRVLFRFHAPDGAQKVFLAGSFNNYADNVNGAVTDEKYALAKAGDGFYWTRVFLKPELQQYKFVVLDKNGQLDWLADPQVPETDKDGNSVLDFSRIGSIPAAPDREGAPLRVGDQVLFRFRAPADADQVFVAGSFNNFADNKDGVVSDPKYALTRAPNGLFVKRVDIGPTTEKYKFVVVDKDGKTTWLTDPNVEATDEGGNTVVDFGKIERLP